MVECGESHFEVVKKYPIINVDFGKIYLNLLKEGIFWNKKLFVNVSISTLSNEKNAVDDIKEGIFCC